MPDEHSATLRTAFSIEDGLVYELGLDQNRVAFRALLGPEIRATCSVSREWAVVRGTDELDFRGGGQLRLAVSQTRLISTADGPELREESLDRTPPVSVWIEGCSAPVVKQMRIEWRPADVVNGDFRSQYWTSLVGLGLAGVLVEALGRLPAPPVTLLIGTDEDGWANVPAELRLL
jgi:hypothetical protein